MLPENNYEDENFWESWRHEEHNAKLISNKITRSHQAKHLFIPLSHPYRAHKASLSADYFVYSRRTSQPSHSLADLDYKRLVLKAWASRRSTDSWDYERQRSQPFGGIYKARLFHDFSSPGTPKPIELSVQSGAVQCTVSWLYHDLPASFKAKCIQHIQVSDDAVVCDSEELEADIINYKFKTVPGNSYSIRLCLLDQKKNLIAEGSLRCKAVFSVDEIDKLMDKAVASIGTQMQSFCYLHRCKPTYYWDDIYRSRDGIMQKYIKDNNGQAASPINGQIEGLFFSARTLSNGQMPPSSPFGDMRMHLPAYSLLNPAQINIYFCDYYCNTLTHYVTVVVCISGSPTDRFCAQHLRLLEVDSNPFLRIESLGNYEVPFAFFVNKNVWVEIYYTEDVPLEWGKFNRIMATGAGTSKIGGLPHNKSCLTCNLYPIGSSKQEMVEDLVISYEDSRQDNIFERNSTRYTLLGCVQAKLLAPSTSIAISKQDYLEVVEVLVHTVDHVVYEQSAQELARFNPIPIITLTENEEEEEGEIQNSVLPGAFMPESKMIGVLDEIVDAEQGTGSSLLRILASKVKALRKQMNADFSKIRAILNKTIPGY